MPPIAESRPRRLANRGVEIIVLSGDAPDAAYTLLDYRAPPGFAGVQPHWHAVSTEWFYVIAGTLAWTLGERSGETPAGGFVEVPPRTHHVWRNASADTPLHMLIGFDRPHFDDYFRELIALAERQTTWPPADPTPWIKLGERFDTFTGPI